MAQYIDKDALVEEIGRRKEINKYRDTPDGLFEDKAILSFIDTLEVKEVDLEKDNSMKQEQTKFPGYDKALLEVKSKVDELYEEASIGLNEYDSGLYNGIAETCMKLRGFIKARLDSDEQPDLPGIKESGIPGKDYIPVEWVDACEMYGKWKIVKQEQQEVDLEKELDRYLRGEFKQTAGGNFNNYIQVARHFFALGLNARKEE